MNEWKRVCFLHFTADSLELHWLGVVNVMDTPTLNPSPKMREGLQWRKPPLPSLVAGDGGMSSIFTIPHWLGSIIGSAPM